MPNSGNEMASSESSSSDSDIEFTDSSEEMEIVGHVQPYADEPAAHSSDEEADAEKDGDGLSPAVLRGRFEGEVSLNEWCICGECATGNLADALEYRCCREIAQASQKLVFDGSIERVSCVTKHDDFSSMINLSVLLQVAPLLRDRNGRGYRRRAGQTENQFVRAVAYRWLIRWICGYLGWDNSRPLPACVYNQIRLKYPTAQVQGYKSTDQRS